MHGKSTIGAAAGPSLHGAGPAIAGLVVVAGLTWAAAARDVEPATPAQGNTAAATDMMNRDARAEAAVLESSHRLHHYFDTLNVEGIAGEIADDFLFVYEMTPDGKPIKLSSKAELVDWLRTSFKEFGKMKAVTAAKNPVMHARATSNFAIVTEECSLRVLLPDGHTQIQTLRATSVARKGPDGWKWLHWHMSPGAARQTYDKDGNRVVPVAAN